MLTPESRNRDFPSLANRVYLNSAAEGIPPLAVEQAFRTYFADHVLGMDGRAKHAIWHDALRESVGALYGLTAAETSVCSCSSEAYNLAALALRMREGDEVVINDLDFPAGTTPWLQADCPATVKVWRHQGGVLRTEDLAPLLGPKTRFVNVSLVSYYNGFRLPLPPVTELVRKLSPALLGVDVTQALGRIPLDGPDVGLSRADLIVSSTHKWILATHGGGLIGVPQASADRWNVPAGGWLHLRDAFGPNRFEKAESLPGAAGFAVGMPNYPAIYAIRAALDYIRATGVHQIDAVARPLTLRLLDELSRLPVELITPRSPEYVAGIVAFRHPRADEVHRHLHADNIHIMSHAGRLRVAIHGYNTENDIDRLLAGLRNALA
jgi:cysteine desulfurase / selenocysteine lyase